MRTETESVPGEAVGVEALGRELGAAISELPEYEAFEAATEAVKADEEAQGLIRDFEEQRQAFAIARRTGEAGEADLADLQAAQQELHALPVMAEFLEAQAGLVERLEAVNEAISAPLAIDFGAEAGGCCQD